MKYCVIKGSTNIIDSSTFNTDEIFLINASSAGFIESEVEILTEEEYLARKSLEPQPTIVDADEVLKSKIELVTINTLIELGMI